MPTTCTSRCGRCTSCPIAGSTTSTTIWSGTLRAPCGLPTTAADWAVRRGLTELIESDGGASVAAFVQRQADVEQVLELLRRRSIYHLKEAGPNRVGPRLSVGPKAALMELQYDEYGCGDPNRLHSHLFVLGLEACGLRSDYGAYIDNVPVEVLEQNNAMSLFGLHRRHRGAAVPRSGISPRSRRRVRCRRAGSLRACRGWARHPHHLRRARGRGAGPGRRRGLRRSHLPRPRRQVRPPDARGLGRMTRGGSSTPTSLFAPAAPSCCAASI
jgi:hypothetical protein